MGIARIEADRRGVVGKGKIEIVLEGVLQGARVVGGDVLGIDPDRCRVVGDRTIGVLFGSVDIAAIDVSERIIGL